MQHHVTPSATLERRAHAATGGTCPVRFLALLVKAAPSQRAAFADGVQRLAGGASLQEAAAVIYRACGLSEPDIEILIGQAHQPVTIAA